MRPYVAARKNSPQLFRKALERERFKIVNVKDLPLTRRESSYDAVVRFVHTLPSGQGILIKNRSPKPDAESKAVAIKDWANKIGKPVTTQIRHAGGKIGDGQGYRIWIFKRRDFITKRNGHVSRL